MIAILQRVVKWTAGEGGESKGVLKAQVATGGQRQAVSFDLTLGKVAEGKQRLEVVKTA